MAAHILPSDANAWTEATKLSITALETGLLEQIEGQVLGKIGVQFDTSTWLSPETTPLMVKSVIAMLYVAWYYDKTYSEDQEEGNDYAALLRAQAESLIQGILDDSIVLPEVPPGTEPSGPSFYPTDDSSGMCPTPEDPSLGPARFSLGTSF
jgi:hypothetical protein